MSGVQLYVVGAGGHAREIHAYVADLVCGGWQGRLMGFLDDGIPPGMVGSLAVLGPVDGLAIPEGESAYLTALGSNPLRRQMVERVEQRYGGALRPWSLVHPAAYLGEKVSIGEGTCVAPGAVLTAEVDIGRHCIINVRASLSHNCSVGDFVNINPAATLCGNVTVGEGASIGAGAIVREKISIGAWSVIGAGAVVVRDVPPGVTVVGVPARVMEKGG